MLSFFSEYLSTIVIGLILLAAVIGIICKMVRDRKKGGGCSGNCLSCGHCSGCHKE